MWFLNVELESGHWPVNAFQFVFNTEFELLATVSLSANRLETLTFMVFANQQK